jgi:hypothetical protein
MVVYVNLIKSLNFSFSKKSQITITKFIRISKPVISTAGVLPTALLCTPGAGQLCKV